MNQIRDRRRAYAAPGGPLDRRVRLAMNGLPAIVGAIVAVMVVTPLFPRNEVSFLLDRNKVAITHDRLQVNAASYRGVDDKGKPFVLNAGHAVQHSARVPVVMMQDLTARLEMSDGPTQLVAANADYNITQDRVDIAGPVTITGADGSRMVTSGVTVDLKSHKAYGTKGVSGELPQGSFTSQRVSMDLDSRVVTLDGRAHLRMTPGKASTRR